jgi:succinyl-diaminopimelate desuccinylase
MSATLDLARDLIARPSVTPEDAGCLDLMGTRLERLGFVLERMPFGDVDNLWARRGTETPLFAFAGHTDVVPPGPLEAWTSPPFEPTDDGEYLRGRGAADMKGSLAAMITATERFVANHAAHSGSIAFLLTSDEEGPSINGTVRVIEALTERGEHIDYALVGEPTSVGAVGDMVKNGRRGSLNARIRVHGKQGHVAYPHMAINPIHTLAPALAELAATEWDTGSEYFPPTTFQVSNLNAGTGVENVIPGELEAWLNFRFSTAQTDSDLKARVHEVLDRHGVNYTATWKTSGQPFLTPAGALVSAVEAAITKHTGQTTELSTTGGTSDGRFIAPTGAEVVELGPVNATIHQVNECVRRDDLDTLSACYESVLETLLIPA